jgi:hypothetical protein
MEMVKNTPRRDRSYLPARKEFRAAGQARKAHRKNPAGAIEARQYSQGREKDTIVMKRFDKRKLLAEFRGLRASLRGKFSYQEIVNETKRVRKD